MWRLTDLAGHWRLGSRVLNVDVIRKHEIARNGYHGDIEQRVYEPRKMVALEIHKGLQGVLCAVGIAKPLSSSREKNCERKIAGRRHRHT